MRRTLSAVVASAAALIWACVPIWGAAIGPNMNAQPGITTNSAFQGVTGANWSPNPQDVTFDVTAGPWLKNLTGFDNAVLENGKVPQNVGASLKERANNVGGLPWYRWTETITTAGWAFASGGAQTFPGGVIVGGTLSNNDQTITFSFQPLAPNPNGNNRVATEKMILCVAAAGCAPPSANAPLVVKEFPTAVPEPGSLGLVSLALVAVWRLSGKRHHCL